VQTDAGLQVPPNDGPAGSRHDCPSGRRGRHHNEGAIMDKNDKPEAFGVFKPVGHVIVSFEGERDAQAAEQALVDAGFGAGDVVYYSPEQMKRQADIDIDNAGVLATIGQELNLVKAHRDLAEQGASFLVVKAPEDEAAQQVAAISRRFGATRAQQYGRLIIEELIEPGSGEKQVAESPDRGIDAQTESGREGNQPYVATSR
jgi:hypothetical protein